MDVLASLFAREGKPEWGDQSVRMHETPERLNERVSISASLIDNMHTDTWGDAGLIIEAPQDTVVLTSSTDAGVVNSDLDDIMNRAGKQSVLTGDELLQRSRLGEHNEVVVVPGHNDSPVELRGFFYKVAKSGRPRNEVLLDRMQMHALRLGLPIVEIVERCSGYVQNSVKIDGDRIAVEFDGYRYLLGGFGEKGDFYKIDDTGWMAFATPSEIDDALDYAVSSGGLLQSEADQIKADYQNADIKRETPTALFDESGELKRIVCRTGYGEDEREMYIERSGYAAFVNLKQQARANQECMLNGGSVSLFELYQPLSPCETDKMVKTACQKLDSKRTKTLCEWYGVARNKIKSRWEANLARSVGYGGLGLVEELKKWRCE